MSPKTNTFTETLKLQENLRRSVNIDVQKKAVEAREGKALRERILTPRIRYNRRLPRLLSPPSISAPNSPKASSPLSANGKSR